MGERTVRLWECDCCHATEETNTITQPAGWGRLDFHQPPLATPDQVHPSMILCPRCARRWRPKHHVMEKAEVAP